MNTKTKIKPKRLNKQQRLEVYNKYNGHCAYCGKKIEYKEMQVDHQIPQYESMWLTEEENNSIIFNEKNYYCSCRICNLYKRANSLDIFRKWIEEIPLKLSKVFIFKVGINYNLINVQEKPIKFFFEQWEENENKYLKPLEIGTNNYIEYVCPTCHNTIGFMYGCTFESKTMKVNDFDRCPECNTGILW